LIPIPLIPFLKLAELLPDAGIKPEAREQYFQAAEFFKKRKQIDRALEVFRKLVQLNPENINFRNRLAAECEQAGKWDLAALAYSESAEILLRRDDRKARETALNRAAGLDSGNSKIQTLRARVGIMLGRYEQAEQIINASPELQSDAAGRRILLDAYLGSQKVPEAMTLVQQVFRANPADFAPIGSVCAVLLEKGHVDEAFSLLDSVAEPVIAHDNAGPLLEALAPHLERRPPTHPHAGVESIASAREPRMKGLCRKVLEALGRAYDLAGDLEKGRSGLSEAPAARTRESKAPASAECGPAKLGREKQTP